ncbi:MAG TPA: PAS domain S-box protein [Terriglobia bacterium]|nr:PAS domain S-box protein [Terriglobia bacterium]
MSIPRSSILAMQARVKVLLQSSLVRYGLTVALVAATFAVKLWMIPLTGTGAPFVLFFAVILLISLLLGVGPGILSVLLSIPLGAYTFVVRAGYPIFQAVFQSLLFSLDGIVVVYLTSLMKKNRKEVQDANERLQTANQEIAESAARTRAIVELAPDAFFLADLDGRYTDVNQAACRLLGYTEDELIGNTIYAIIPAEDTSRLNAERADLLTPGRTSRSEWMLKRKNGTRVPGEVSATILSAGRWLGFARDISERRQAEDELRVFVSFLENSSDFIGIADPAGKPIYLNPAGRRLVGLSPEFPVERVAIQDCYPPELRSFATDVILKTMMERGQWTGETYLRHWQTEEAIPVSDTHFLIRDADGERILGMGTITRDISEARRITREREDLLVREQLARRQVEIINDQLRESEERVRLTVDEAPIGMALVALDGRFVRVNRVLCEIVGYSPDELTGLTFQTITHPDDLDKDVALVGRLARGEIARYQLEKRYVRKDGSIVNIMLSASVLRGRDGAARYYIAQMEDITERKRAEEALRRSEAKFSGIVSIAADAIISIGADQRIIIFNEGAESIFGYAKDEVIGAPLDILLPERFRALHRRHVAEFAASDESARRMSERSDVFGLRKNGEEFPAEASISKVDVDHTTFLSVVLRDVTSRKAIEEALRRAVAMREQVLEIVAHDLRNPLNNILIQCSLLEELRPREERRNQKPLEIISRAAARMNHLIQDLLDVTLVEQGQMRIDRGRLSAAGLVAEAVETQRPLAAASGIELHLDIKGAARDIWGGRDRLLQVFENLIGNAIKFSSAGGRITVGAAFRGQVVEFSVADTGCGIAPENLPHVFNPFWQATASARRFGVGLGLPIAKGIVEAHGGRIWVESALGKGTTFFFTIPEALAPPNLLPEHTASKRIA